MNKIKLKISDKDIEFHFGLGFLGTLLKDLDISIDELMGSLQKNPFEYLPKIMHCAASYACLRKGEELGLSLYDLIDLIDEDGGIVSENMSKFLEAFTNSMSKDVPEEPKKKTVKAGKSKTIRK